MIRQEQIPYHADSNIYFTAIEDLAWPMWLDNQQSQGWDILVAKPKTVLRCQEGKTYSISANGDESPEAGDAFSVLQRHLGKRQPWEHDFPFVGGAVGFWGYDLGRQLENVPERLAPEYTIPDMLIGLYDWALLVNHEQQKAYLVSGDSQPISKQNWSSLIQRFSSLSKPRADKHYHIGQPCSNMTEDAYQSAFAQVKYHIRMGDCYQVNLAQRFTMPFEGDPLSAYCSLRKKSQARFGAYIPTGDNQSIWCFSPERFLKVDFPNVETKPIKGTRPRASDPKHDQHLAQSLLLSEKDRAENVMIVDLMRNDLNRVCSPGSVDVPHLFALESFPAVHHLVSTVTGALPETCSPVALLKACFPGGSITGVPKPRVLEIIESLEPNRRGIYCGSIGYIGYDWKMDSNIVIRTMAQEGSHVHCWAGGGLVFDSEVESEYQETFDKIQLLLKKCDSLFE